MSSRLTAMLAAAQQDQFIKQRDEREAERIERQYNEENVARWALSYAIKDGKVIKPAECSQKDEHCEGRIEGHHARGYDEAHKLDVDWLCLYHHKKADARQNKKWSR